MTTRFLHLSDIHFTFRAPAVGFDPDRDVRNEVLRDIREQVAATGAISAVLVSGDIAYAGKKSEFADATVWLDEVCNAAQCSTSSVYVCPGNHDVDRSVLLENSTIQDVHDAIRREPSWQAQDAKLLRRLQEPETGRLLFRPLQEYNEFAARYECSFYSDSKSFAWDKDFPLNDGSVLRLRGMNSALLSGPSDTVRTLCLGSHAWTMSRHDGVEYMVMSHHPPGWLMDGSDAQGSFDAKSRIQLFGHEHDQRIMPGRDYVRLFAGSINPHRSEHAWRPGYNIINVAVTSENGFRELVVDVRLREWSRQSHKFQALENVHGQQVDQTRIRLAEWTPPTTWLTPPSPSEEAIMPSTESTPSTPDPRPVRDVINAFFRLTVSQKNEVTNHLSLIEAADSGLPDFERYKRALTRARDVGKWELLEELVDQMEKAG